MLKKHWFSCFFKLGEPSWAEPGESGSAWDLYLPLKILSENPLGILWGYLVREKTMVFARFVVSSLNGLWLEPLDEL